MGKQVSITLGLVLAVVGFGLSCGVARADAPAPVSGVSSAVTPAMLDVSAPAGMMVAPRAPSASRTDAGDSFISLDTVIVGCTAGATAGAMAIALPVVTMASTGVGLPASATALVGTAGIGCGVGAASSLAAMGTAWALNVLEGQGIHLRR